MKEFNSDVILISFSPNSSFIYLSSFLYCKKLAFDIKAEEGLTTIDHKIFCA